MLESADVAECIQSGIPHCTLLLQQEQDQHDSRDVFYSEDTCGSDEYIWNSDDEV